MKRLRLTSFLRSDHGTFGALEVPGFSFFTCEDDHLRIPEGAYTLKRSVWHAGGGAPTYEITGIPGHERVLFHWGNTEEDTRLCVLLGLSLGFLTVDQDEETGARRTKLAVLKSRSAFDRFMAIMGGDETAVLEVRRQEN